MKRINIVPNASPNGGIGIGVMTSAGNPWTVPDALAEDLRNRKVATFFDPESSGAQAVTSQDGFLNVGGQSVPLSPSSRVPSLSALTRTLGFDVPCNDAAAVGFRDVSGCLNHIFPRTEVVAPNANAGYFTSEAGTNKFAFIPVEKFNLDLAADSFFVSFTVKMAVPGVSTVIMGNTNASTAPGFYVSARTDGKVVPVLWTPNSGVWNSATTWGTNMLGIACDGTDHTVTFAWCAKSRSVLYWLDGIYRQTWVNVLNPGAAARFTFNLGFGSQTGVTGGSSNATQLKNLKARIFPGAGLPMNIGSIVKRMVADPLDLSYLNDFSTEALNYVALAWGPAQSNEFRASDYPDINDLIGALTKDGVSNVGSVSITPATNGSMHPAIQGLAGRRSTWLQTFATAIGGSSATQYWCGQFVAWAAVTTYCTGAYAVAAGNVYRLSASSGGTPAVAVTGAAPPAWPGAGSVVDSEATWTYVRAATAADVVGTVLDMTNPLFDPNGAFALIKAGLDPMPAFFKRYVAISIGQGDKSVGATQSQYTAALVNATNYLLAQGYKVLIGFTCSGITAGLNTWLSTVGKPGYLAARAAFAGNPNVVDGYDAYTGLGVLTRTSDGPGLLPDDVHANHFARDLWAVGWDGKLAAAGA